MSAPPFMKFYVAEYLSDTTHLTALEHGAYLLLLMGMWRAGGTLPANDEKLRRIARCTPEQWTDVKDEVLSFFQHTGGCITSKRLVEEMDRYTSIVEKRKTASELGVSAKANKNNEKSEPFGSDVANHLVTKEEEELEEERKEPPNPQTGEASLFGEIEAPEPPDEVQAAFDLWNQTAQLCDLPRARTLDDGRRRAIRKRLESGGLDLWRSAMEAVKVSAFLRGLRKGSDGRAFRADLTFVCQAKSFQRLLDGGYGADASPPSEVIAFTPEDPWRTRCKTFVRNIWWQEEWGPMPGRDGCEVPAELLAEFGISLGHPDLLRRRAAQH